MTPEFADSIDGGNQHVQPATGLTTSSEAAILAARDAELIPEPPVQAVATQMADVAVDTVKLLDLQVRLFEAELAQSAKQLVQPLVQFAGAYVLGTASLIVLLFALSAGLQSAFGMPAWLALFLVAAAGAGVTYFAIQTGIAQIKTPRISFSKSKEELMRNAAVLASLMKSR